jgi:glycosyltransferase involved in cell wall biosynthesis
MECAFYAGKRLIGAGKKVCFDFEDWYSRDYLIPSRPVGLLMSLEKFALENGLFCTTTSKVMAQELKNVYGISKEITVIYNGFSMDELVECPETTQIVQADTNTKIIWFSRTIGPGRGIELFLKTLLVCENPVELHLLGKMKEGYKEFLEKEFTLLRQHKLVIHPFMPHAQILSFISQFQIGLAIEENINDNKKLTVSNKLLQYLQSGIAVIASNTKGQQEVAHYFPETVMVVDTKHPGLLLKAIDLLANKGRKYKEEQIDTFNKIFSWESQETKLNELLKKNL